MSWFTYSRNRRRARRATTRSASSRSAAATTADAGRLRATSAARFGPDRAAIRPGSIPAPSAMTSLIREQRAALEALDDREHVRGSRRGTDQSPPPSSAGGRTGPRTARDRSHRPASRHRPSRSTVFGRSTPGRRRAFWPVALIAAAVSAEWQTSVTGSTRAMTLASVVPHAPAPTTATRGPSIRSPRPADRAFGNVSASRSASLPVSCRSPSACCPSTCSPSGRRPCPGCACGAAA